METAVHNTSEHIINIDNKGSNTFDPLTGVTEMFDLLIKYKMSVSQLFLIQITSWLPPSFYKQTFYCTRKHS